MEFYPEHSLSDNYAIAFNKIFMKGFKFKNKFSEKFNVRDISTILFIALVASLFLKYLPISEIKLVPLLIGIGFLNLFICFVVITNVTRFYHIGKTLYLFVLGGYVIFC